jgi:hypothetical protein
VAAAEQPGGQAAAGDGAPATVTATVPPSGQDAHQDDNPTAAPPRVLIVGPQPIYVSYNTIQGKDLY